MSPMPSAWVRSSLFACVLATGCVCNTVIIDHPDGSADAGADAGTDAGADGGTDGSVDGGGDGGLGPRCGDTACNGTESCLSCPGDCGRCSCPVDGGVDGVGVCGAWQLGSWNNPCTSGYTRTRTCDAAYDCRITDQNGCSAPLNVGGAPPAGCAACGGGGGSLQYFGYWRDSDMQNYVCQIQDHVNYTMTNNSQAIVDLAATYGVANFGTQAPTGGSPAPLGGVVVRDDADCAAYGWCASHACPNGIIDGWAAVKAEIEAAGDAEKAQHPNAHLMINLGDGDANGQLDFRGIPGFTLPRGVDWVGLECYTGAANCQANMNALRPLLPSGARTWVITAGTDGFGTEAWLTADAQAMYDWANADPAVIGLIAFVWSRTILCPPDCSALAVKEMPTLLAKYRDLGDRITGRGGIAPIPDSQCPTP